MSPKPPQAALPEWEDLVTRPEPAAPARDPRPVPGARSPLPAGAPRGPAREAEGQMAASYLTHELRAPLTSVRSALSLLQESRGLSDEDRSMLELALRNSDRLSRLIDDIMDYSKLEAARMKLEAAPIAPRTLLQEAMECLGAWAISKGVRLVRAAEPEPLPRVMADARRAVQVLTNLLSNAIKYTSPGGRVEVSAKLGRREHAGTIVFSVKDTGCGIDPRDVDRIFNCFEQASHGEKVADGTGLGLHLAKRMVELHGGRIWVESWKGLGTTFRFTIPISRGDMPAPIEVYPKPMTYHGLLVDLFRRFNAVLAYFL